MPQEYYNLKKAAEVLGLAPADVHHLREQNELRGYRDGADWKFKVEDVQNKLAELIKSRQGGSKPDQDEEETDDVLLSEAALGESGAGASGSVIGGELAETAEQEDSDLKLVESSTEAGGEYNVESGDEYDIAQAEPDRDDMDTTVTTENIEKRMAATVPDDDVEADMNATIQAGGDRPPPTGAGSSSEDLDLTIDQDATLDDSQVPVEEGVQGLDDLAGGSGSSIDLSEALEDDNLVLGGSSGSGSDITIGGDSGISLVDPADSGLSLEDPVDLVAASDESLELGEDDMLIVSEAADTEAPTAMESSPDFELTPMDDDMGDEDSESGSQVIALDMEGEGDESATMVGQPRIAATAMLDEDFAADEATAVAEEPLAAAAPAEVEGAEIDVSAAGPRVAAGAAVAPAAALPEAPYSVWNVLSLTFCTIFLIMTGMMLYDLLRNMWSWQGAYDINSTLMDQILNLVGG